MSMHREAISCAHRARVSFFGLFVHLFKAAFLFWDRACKCFLGLSAGLSIE